MEANQSVRGHCRFSVIPSVNRAECQEVWKPISPLSSALFTDRIMVVVAAVGCREEKFEDVFEKTLATPVKIETQHIFIVAGTSFS